MELNLSNVPFTCRDSYMVVSWVDSSFRIMGKASTREGLYLRSVRGGSRYFPFITKLTPTVDSKAVPYTYKASETMIEIDAQGRKIEIEFADCSTLLVRGSGDGIGLDLTEWSDKAGGDGYVLPLPVEDQIYYKANVFKNDTTLILGAEKGRIAVDQAWDGGSAEDCTVHCSGEHGFLIAIEEARCEWHPHLFTWDFDECAAGMRKTLDRFTDNMPSVPAELSESRRLAAYIDWASRVKKDGFLTRPALYPSKNWMVGAFSWDQCFIAQALSYHLPDEAWDQFMIMFDYQDETGRIPDAVTDNYTVWNFCKPPVHGWTMLRLMENMELSKAQLEEGYRRLAAWTNWWYDYRDTDHDGVCEYHHGNDSGWDNSTVFKDSPAIESPDLSGELFLQCKALAEVARRLGKKEEQRYWTWRMEKQKNDLLAHCFEGNRPVAIDRATHKKVECDSLLPYTVILMGKDLPKEKADYIVHALKTDFLTEYGFATEKTNSPLYQSDGYWRGPIWAPTMVMVLDGLWQIGEKDFVRDVAGRFAKLVGKTGFSENFDSVTGEGNRDRAFSWSASSFLVIAHRYLM